MTSVYGQQHEISVHIAYARMPLINARTDVSSKTLCMRATKALANLRIFADSPESLPHVTVKIRSETSCSVQNQILIFFLTNRNVTLL